MDNFSHFKEYIFMKDEFQSDESINFDSKQNIHINDYEKLIFKLKNIKKRLDLLEKKFLFE